MSLDTVSSIQDMRFRLSRGDTHRLPFFLALAVDMTARNVQDKVKAKGLPWSAAKGFDTFCPIG